MYKLSTTLARQSAYIGTAVGVVTLFAGVAPIVGAMLLADRYALSSPADVFRFVMGFSPINLLLPLIVSLPYATVVSGEISHRYLLYTRTREPIGTGIRHRFGTAALVGFVVGFVVPLLVFVWAFAIEPSLGIVALRPELSGLTTAAQIQAADLQAFTFSQLLAYGDVAFGLGYSLFTGATGALYSVITVSCLFMMTNRFLATATPWIVHVAVLFVMAVLNLAPVSPNAFFPFNLSQTSMSLPMIPLAVLAALAAVLVTVVHRRATSWESWQ
ncbi:hypothetical protein [Micropruina sp.]|uniref:hypothetical protein n=1 Tax=Micropruina sp. TaxID=2737536 RepID=UPI0039E6AF59